MKKKNFNMKQFHKTMALWILIILVALSLFRVVEQTKDTSAAIQYSEFRDAVKAGNAASVEIGSDNVITGTYKTPVQDKKTFRTQGSAQDAGLVELLDKHQVKYANKQVRKLHSGSRLFSAGCLFCFWWRSSSFSCARSRAPAARR